MTKKIMKRLAALLLCIAMLASGLAVADADASDQLGGGGFRS